MHPLPDSATLGEAKQWLRAHIEEGAPCPCCTQFAKVYRRRIHGSQARVLISLYREYGALYGYLPDIRLAIGIQANDEPMLRHWDLIVEEPSERSDGGRAGWWRLTELGLAWVKGEASVPKFAVMYDNRRLRLDGPPTTIRDALGTKFNLAELMGWDLT